MAIPIEESMPIKWRLAVLMADREIDYKKLADGDRVAPCNRQQAQKYKYSGNARETRQGHVREILQSS